jgi:hypothetical protein
VAVLLVSGQVWPVTPLESEMKLSRFAAGLVAGGLVIIAPTAQPRAMAQSTSKPSGGVDLRPRFKVGQETRLQMDMDVNGKQSTPSAGEGGLMQQKVGGTLRLKCRETNPETGSTLEMQFESLKIKATTPVGAIDFDSSKPADPEDMTGDAIRSMMMTMLTVKMDPSGNITSVDGGAGGAMGLMGGPDMIKDLLKNSFGPISTTSKGSGRYNIGDTWKNEDVINGGLGTMRTTTINKLRSMTGAIANIDITGSVTLDPSSASQGITIKDSSIRGDAKWDTEAGMLDSMNMTQHYSVEQRQAQGAPVRTTQDVQMKVTRLHGAAAPKPTPDPGTVRPKNR